MPFTAGMTSSPVYNKVQLFYSINPDEYADMTNYYIFPDFINDDPLCAITERKSVTATCTGTPTSCATLTGSTTSMTSFGMDSLAIPEYNPGWW